MNQSDIQAVVARVLEQYGLHTELRPNQNGMGQEIPLEVSARHVHLSKADVEVLFGKGARLTKKRELSQPGEFLSEQRVKLVTRSGEIANVAVLGPERQATQVELSITDCRTLHIKAPVNLSGNLTGAADVVLVGDHGIVEAAGSVIVAKAHIHMHPNDASRLQVSDGQKVSVRINGARPVTFHDILVRVAPNFALAMHIDFDEANACCTETNASAYLIKEEHSG